LILFFLLRGRHHYMWKLPLIARATQWTLSLSKKPQKCSIL
jgi:hypothetical protein